MKIKLDENLPESLVEALSKLGHDVDNVRMEGISGRADLVVWKAAQADTRLLITQDLDFSDFRQFAPGTHYGLMLVRLRLPGRRTLRDRIVEAFRCSDSATWAKCFVLLTDTKIRVHRPAE